MQSSSQVSQVAQMRICVAHYAFFSALAQFALRTMSFFSALAQFALRSMPFFSVLAQFALRSIPFLQRLRNLRLRIGKSNICYALIANFFSRCAIRK